MLQKKIKLLFIQVFKIFIMILIFFVSISIENKVDKQLILQYFYKTINKKGK